MGPGLLPSYPGAGQTWALAHNVPLWCALRNYNHNYKHLNDPQKKEEKMPPRMCWKGGRGHRPDLGVSITFPGPESIPATLHPLLAKPHQNKTLCWNEAAVVQKQLNTTQPGPQGSHSVHRPLNPALGRTVPLFWFCFCRKLCVVPGALLQLSDVFLKVL